MSNPGMVSGGYIMGQGPGGVPMAIPMQGPGGVVMVPVSSSGAVGVHPQMMHPQMVQMPGGGVVQVAGQPLMYQGSTPAGAIGMQPQMVQVPTSGGLVGQPQAVQGQMVQLPASGTVAAPPYDQTVHVPSSGAEGVQGQFARVTPDGPEKAGQEAT